MLPTQVQNPNAIAFEIFKCAGLSTVCECRTHSW